MLIRGTTRLLGLLGNPLSHSYSPAMHNSAIEKLGLDLVYLPLKVETRGVEACLKAIRELEFLGVNVTIPHKLAVIPFLDEVSELSRIIGGVNTIVCKNGKLSGTTTDLEGFLAGFREAGHSFDGKTVVILGNGGTARTLAFTLLLMAKPSRVIVAARDVSKSKALAHEVHEKIHQTLEVLDLAEYSKHAGEFEVIVNATPVGMFPNAGQSPLQSDWLRKDQIIYDLIYNPEETRLLQDARKQGCQTVGGLAMLVHQGIASFKLWTGVDPDPAFFYEGIRNQQKLQKALV